MDTLNMGVMVNLSGQTDDDLKESVQYIKDHYPNRFVIFANISFNGNVGKKGWIEETVNQLERDVKNGVRGLKVYKSLGLRDKDVHGERVAINDARLNPIWAKCRKLGLPVLIHAAYPKYFWDDFNGDN